MKKALLTLMALAVINSAEAKKIPLDAVTKGVHPLEEIVLKNVELKADTFDLYYDCKFPKGPRGWAIFSDGEKNDTSYSSLRLYMPELPREYSPWGFFRSLVTIELDKYYRSINTEKDTLYALNQNTYAINGINLILFWDGLIKKVCEEIADYNGHSKIDPGIIMDVKIGEDSCYAKTVSLKTNLFDVHKVYGNDYALVKFTSLDGFGLQSISFFANMDYISWIYIQASPYPDIRAVNRNFFRERDEFYKVFKRFK